MRTLVILVGFLYSESTGPGFGSSHLPTAVTAVRVVDVIIFAKYGGIGHGPCQLGQAATFRRRSGVIAADREPLVRGRAGGDQ
jgi:hypothetical protein